MGFWNKLVDGAEAINRYFADGVAVYMHTNDSVVRAAVLTAAKVAAGAQRQSMVQFLLELARKVTEEYSGVARNLNDLADEICLRNWTMKDVRSAKRALGELDRMYADSLDRVDAAVFRRRFPQLFGEPATAIQFFVAAITSYLIFDDAAAGLAATLTAVTSPEPARINMAAVLAAISLASDTLFLLFIAADATSEAKVHARPLSETAAAFRQLANALRVEILRSHPDEQMTRATLQMKAPGYERAVRDLNLAAFSRLRPVALDRLNGLFS